MIHGNTLYRSPKPSRTSLVTAIMGPSAASSLLSNKPSTSAILRFASLETVLSAGLISESVFAISFEDSNIKASSEDGSLSLWISVFGIVLSGQKNGGRPSCLDILLDKDIVDERRSSETSEMYQWLPYVVLFARRLVDRYRNASE